MVFVVILVVAFVVRVVAEQMVVLDLLNRIAKEYVVLRVQYFVIVINIVQIYII